MERADILTPGRSRHLVLPSEAVQVQPDFFANRNPQDANWVLRVRRKDGQVEEFIGADWEAVSRFGAVRAAVVVDDEGKPVFDRARYEEAPNVNIVAWGRDRESGQIRVAVISQPRPHVDDIFDKETDNDVVFAQIPMGFLNRVVGNDQIEIFESSKQGAARETQEETGATVVKDIFQPEYPQHAPNLTFVGTWSELAFVEVDLDMVEELKSSRNEPIFKAEYIPLKQLWSDIRAGKTDRGLTRMCTSNSAFLIWLSNLGKLYRNSKERD